MRVAKGQYCSAPNCGNNKGSNPDLTFFKFPNAKDPERSKTWVINCGRQDLQEKSPQYLRDNCSICQNHFEDGQFMNSEKKRLVFNGVPTLFNVPNAPKRLTLKRKLPRYHAESSSSITKTFSITRSSSSKKSKSGNDSKDTNINSDCAPTDQHMELLEVSPSQVKDAQLSEKDALIERLKATLYNQNKVIRRLKAQTKEKKASDMDKTEGVCIKYLTEAQVEFLMNQLKMAKCKPRGRRWSDEVKMFALCLSYRSGTQAYNYLSRCFSLPSIRILQKYVEKIKLQPRINPIIFDLLKAEVKNL